MYVKKLKTISKSTVVKMAGSCCASKSGCNAAANGEASSVAASDSYKKTMDACYVAVMCLISFTSYTTL